MPPRQLLIAFLGQDHHRLPAYRPNHLCHLFLYLVHQQPQLYPLLHLLRPPRSIRSPLHLPHPTPPLQVTTSDGSTITVVVNPTNSATPISESAFLQNKTASGIVFAIVGIVALVIIIAIAVFAIRRRNHNRLVDAISFDPGVINPERGSMDKTSIRSSGSSRNYVQPHGFQRPYYAPGAIAPPNYPRL
ncbi:hypothetical protein F5887DRAFT_200264 [Amanita rubescens]|nr:hypothetical protein F5887DRAFT_200264 [Amanita rubescens]